MENTTLSPIIIEKETISDLIFPKSAINKTADELKVLKHSLRRAMILGNLHRTKIKIVFEDDKGLKEVRTTVWAVGDKNIVLKQGTIIPINRIVSIV